MKSLLHIAIFLFFSPLCFAQVVWPGDVNNNGIVSEVDLLYLGFAFNETGAARTNASPDWEGQAITTTWENSFPNGLNFAYADCNGDGVIDEADADVIQANLSLTHDDVPFVADEILVATPEIDPQFGFMPNNPTVAPNTPSELLVSLTNNGEAIDNILGLAFTINYDPKFFKAGSQSFEFLGNAWISPFNNDNTFRIIERPDEGKIIVGFTATDRQPVSGEGFIGTVSFVIQEDVIDFLVQTDTVELTIDSVTVVTDDLEKIAVAGATAVIEIEGRTTSTYDPILDEIKMYPNPNRGWLLLKTNDVPIERVEVVNALGQVVYQKQLNRKDFHSLDLQAVPEGMYWLRMISALGTKSVPIQRL